VGWVDARFRRDGVGLTLHAIGGNRAQDGQIVRGFVPESVKAAWLP